MANVKLYMRNALTLPGVTLKNGTGGGAPAIEEDPDWPLTHNFSADRETYWRTSAAPPNPVKIDFDLGSAQSIIAGGMLKIRTYGGLTNVVQTIRYISGAGVYDPADGAWTDAVSGVSANAHNHLAYDPGTSISARYWRFSLASAIAFSCKLWLVKAADFLDLGKDWSIGTEQDVERLREVLVSPAGLAFAFEPAQERGSTIFGGKFLLRGKNQALRDILRDQLTTIDTRFVIRLGDGTLIETSLPEGALEWERVWAPPEVFNLTLPLVEHP